METREAGMYDSDRCRFCHDFYFKARSYICVDCFERAAELMQAEGWQSPKIKANNGWFVISEQTPPQCQPLLLCSERGTVALGWARKDGEIETDLPRGVEFEPFWWQLPPATPAE